VKILNLFIVFLRVSIAGEAVEFSPCPEAQGVTTEVRRNAACPTK
jgi:hypothetical protein